MIKNYSVSALRALMALDHPDQHHLGPPPTALATWSRSPISAQAWEAVPGLSSLTRSGGSGDASCVWEGAATLEAWVTIAQAAPLLGKG